MLDYVHSDTGWSAAHRRRTRRRSGSCPERTAAVRQSRSKDRAERSQVRYDHLPLPPLDQPCLGPARSGVLTARGVACLNLAGASGSKPAERTYFGVRRLPDLPRRVSAGLHRERGRLATSVVTVARTVPKAGHEGDPPLA